MIGIIRRCRVSRVPSWRTPRVQSVHTNTMDRMEDIEDIHKLACQQKHETYVDPNSGLTVFTEYSHLKRGRCCGCGCRHCPFRAGKKSKGKSCEHKDGCSAVTPSTSESVGSRSSERPESEKEPKNLVYTKTGDKLNKHKEIDGMQIGEYFGYSMDCGDFNGDGLADVIVGAPYYSRDTSGQYLILHQQNKPYLSVSFSPTPLFGTLLQIFNCLRSAS